MEHCFLNTERGWRDPGWRGPAQAPKPWDAGERAAVLHLRDHGGGHEVLRDRGIVPGRHALKACSACQLL